MEASTPSTSTAAPTAATSQQDANATRTAASTTISSSIAAKVMVAPTAETDMAVKVTAPQTNSSVTTMHREEAPAPVSQSPVEEIMLGPQPQPTSTTPASVAVTDTNKAARKTDASAATAYNNPEIPAAASHSHPHLENSEEHCSSQVSPTRLAPLAWKAQTTVSSQKQKQRELQKHHLQRVQELYQALVERVRKKSSGYPHQHQHQEQEPPPPPPLELDDEKICTRGETFQFECSLSLLEMSRNDPPVVTRLVESYLPYFIEEGGINANKPSCTIDVVLYRLLLEHRPTLVTTVVGAENSSAHRIILEPHDVLLGGPHYATIVRRIRGCFKLAYAKQHPSSMSSSSKTKKMPPKARPLTTGTNPSTSTQVMAMNPILPAPQSNTAASPSTVSGVLAGVPVKPTLQIATAVKVANPSHPVSAAGHWVPAPAIPAAASYRKVAPGVRATTAAAASLKPTPVPHASLAATNFKPASAAVARPFVVAAAASLKPTPVSHAKLAATNTAASVVAGGATSLKPAPVSHAKLVTGNFKLAAAAVARPSVVAAATDVARPKAAPAAVSRPEPVISHIQNNNYKPVPRPATAPPNPGPALVKHVVQPNRVAATAKPPPSAAASWQKPVAAGARPPPEAFRELVQRRNPQTPDRGFGVNNYASHTEATPLHGNTTKSRQRQFVPPSQKQPATTSDLGANYKRKRRDETKLLTVTTARNVKQKNGPMVTPDQLTYDWSALNLNGTKAWNRMLRQRMLEDPVAYPTVPQVNALDTYNLVQQLKRQLYTIPPPERSPLHAALAHSPPPPPKDRARALVVHGVRGALVSSIATIPPSPPSSCPDDLRPMYSRMANVYQDMMAQDAAANAHNPSLRQRSYQFKTATEMRQHLIDAEQGVAELAVREDRVLRTARQLGLWDNDDAAVTPKAPSKDETEPVYWQKNFTALLRNRDPSMRYLMPHDNF